MYIIKKTISGHDYYYLRESVRNKGKVISKNIAYLGKDRGEAEKKAKGIIDSIKKTDKLISDKNRSFEDEKQKGDIKHIDKNKIKKE